MKRIAFSAVLLSIAGAAIADYTPTSIHWPKFEVSTSEDLVGDHRITHYPIGNMFDGDPKTAWVFKRNPPRKLSEGEEPWNMSKHWGGKYAVSIAFKSETDHWDSRTTTLDGIELMNGYNKSESVFRRNNRIIEIAIYDGTSAYDQKPIKTVRLSDKMGWHRISLPRKEYDGLVIAFTGIRKGRDDDVCVSELRVLNGGRPVSMTFPKMYMATTGSECG